MSLNTKGNGKPICQVGKKIISVTDDNSGDKTYKLEKKDEIYIPAIDKNTEREIVFCAAASGSGKSYWCKKYIEQYHKAYPKRPVYVFSSLMDDPTIDSLKYLKRIKIKDDKFLSLELGAEDFKDSLVMFDDTDCISNKRIAKKLIEILDSILDVGRHFNVSLIYTSHIICNGNKTKHIISEAHRYVLYPLTSSKKHLDYMLSTYLGFDKDQIKKLIDLDGRAKVICKTYPITVYGDKEVYVRV